MLRKLRERIHTDEKGFTLIELLVVILIIGILAAIAIPSFLSQTDKADDASAKSAARNAQTAAETYRVDQGGTYAGLDAPALVAIEATLADAIALTATPNAGNDGYTVSADGEDTGTTFTITRASDGTVDRTCDNPGEGGCTDEGGAGVW